jgi:hypothetical protein
MSTMKADDVLAEMKTETGNWSRLKKDDDLKAAIELAKVSLEEVKSQTEYQDEKATRLLTITTFLSALSGALFSQFEDSYPIGSIKHASHWVAGTLTIAYVVFLVSILTALLGALVVFHATQTRFKYGQDRTSMELEEDPKSLLFFLGLVWSRPRAWVKGWVSFNDTDSLKLAPILRRDLEQRYFENLVSETYLVAAKAADKVRYLEPAQSLLGWSLRVLFGWLLLLAIIAVFITPTKQQPPNPVVAVTVTVSPSVAQTVPSQLPKPASAAPQLVGNVHPSGKGQSQ